MLQFSDNPYRYFPPKPNRLIAWLGEQWNGRCHLPGTRHLISKVEVENAGPLLDVHSQHGARVLLLPNHSTHSDPQIMVETCRQIGLWSFFMAAYDVFERDAKVAWVMQRMGAFSVDRDGSDRQSLKDAVRSVIDGRYALTIFPEGNVYFMNDRVTPFLDGPAYIAMKAQQELKESGRIFAVPVSIKVSHVTDARPSLREILTEMAAALEVEIDPAGDIVTNVHRVGIAMVRRNLTMRGFLPPNPNYDDLPALLRASTELIIGKLEHKIGIEPKAGAELMDRIRSARGGKFTRCEPAPHARSTTPWRPRGRMRRFWLFGFLVTRAITSAKSRALIGWVRQLKKCARIYIRVISRLIRNALLAYDWVNQLMFPSNSPLPLSPAKQWLASRINSNRVCKAG